MSLKEYKLTPEQYKRANILTARAITLVYIIFLLVVWSTNTFTTGMKLTYSGILIVWFTVTAIVSMKNITKKITMLIMAIAFEMSYLLIVCVAPTQNLMLIFPILITITVYMNQKLMLWGSGGALVLAIVKAILLKASGNYDVVDLRIINVMIMGIVICLVGGMSAVKLLMQFSNEAMDTINAALEHQKNIADEVERVANDVSDEFSLAMYNLDAITTSVDESAASIQEIARGSAKSAEAIQTQANMTSEIQTRLTTTNETADSAKKITEDLKLNIENGKAQSDKLKQQSMIVDDYTSKISDSISKLVSSVGNVSEITGSILSISNQTNLLALNASIEAARAGEAGKGFAVVADQIRKLAEETKQSTEQITSIMDELSSVTNETQTSLKGTVDSIDIQRENVELVYENFVSVEKGINELSAGVSTMNSEVNMVVNANDQIVESISSLATMSEEMSNEADSSSNGMHTLRENMSKFSDVLNNTSAKFGELMDFINKQ